MTRAHRLALGAGSISLLLLIAACSAASPPPAPAKPAAPQSEGTTVEIEATQPNLPPPVAPPPSEPTPVVVATPDAPFRAEAPAAAAEPTFRVPTFKRFKLKNGSDVIFSESHDLPLIELQVVLKTGGAANPIGQAGLADLTANMLDEGTKARTALEIAEQVGTLGSALGSSASWDASTLGVATISRNFDSVLAIWADVLLHPSFSEKELARVRDNLITAVSRRKDSPPTIASLTLARVLFGDRHPYAWPQTGTEESLKKLGVAEVRRFYETYYRPTNATLIVAGDISESALRKKLEAALREWRPGRAPAVKVAPVPSTDVKKIYLVDKPGAPQSSIRVGMQGLRRTDPDYFPVLLMNQILGGSFYRLDMNLRERQQWTYGARSVFDMRRTVGPFSAGGEFVAAHTADAVAEILKEMRIIATTEVSDEELSRAKDNFTKSFPARFATRSSTAAMLGELAVYGLPNSYLADYTKNVNAVTKADVRRVAGKYLLTDKSVIVVVGDRAAQETSLRKLAPIEPRDLDGGPLVVKSTPASQGPANGGGKADKADSAGQD